MTTTVSDYRRALNEYTRTQLELAGEVYACATALSDPDDHRVSGGVCDLFITPEDYYEQKADLKRDWWGWHMGDQRPECEGCREWAQDSYTG